VPGGTFDCDLAHNLRLDSVPSIAPIFGIEWLIFGHLRFFLTGVFTGRERGPRAIHADD